jgi:hypothetical protein
MTPSKGGFGPILDSKSGMNPYSETKNRAHLAAFHSDFVASSSRRRGLGKRTAKQTLRLRSRLGVGRAGKKASTPSATSAQSREIHGSGQRERERPAPRLDLPRFRPRKSTKPYTDTDAGVWSLMSGEHTRKHEMLESPTWRKWCWFRM